MTSEWEALVVGINRYPQTTTLHDLTVAAKDAEDIAVHLRKYGYQPFRVQCLPQQPDQKGEAHIYPTGMVKSAELQEALHTLSGHQDYVTDVAFSPDGKTVLSGSADNTLKLWVNPENWQYVLQLGCSQLRLNWLLASPDNDKAGETCWQYGGWKETEKAEFLVRQGKVIAREKQDINAAIKKFKQAKRLDPDYQLTSLEREAKRLAAPGLVTKGETLLKEDNIKEALSYYQKAQQFDPNSQISAESWNNLCFYGSLNRFEVEVMFACENAVKLAPQEYKVNYQAIRGIAKALTGDKTGAIEDLQAYVNSSDLSDENKAKWQGWLKELKAGNNPFTNEVLQDLRNTGSGE